MDEEKLKQKVHNSLKEFMIDNGISYLWFSASTNITVDDIKSEVHLEMEVDTKDKGFRC